MFSKIDTQLVKVKVDLIMVFNKIMCSWIYSTTTLLKWSLLNQAQVQVLYSRYQVQNDINGYTFIHPTNNQSIDQTNQSGNESQQNQCSFVKMTSHDLHKSLATRLIIQQFFKHQRRQQSSASLVPCEGNPLLLPAERDSNAERVSISWSHSIKR